MTANDELMVQDDELLFEPETTARGSFELVEEATARTSRPPPPLPLPPTRYSPPPYSSVPAIPVNATTQRMHAVRQSAPELEPIVPPPPQPAYPQSHLQHSAYAPPPQAAPYPAPPRFSQPLVSASPDSMAMSASAGSIPRDQPPVRPGDVIGGKYRVHRLSGRVGLGTVAHVRHLELGQRLLLKCLPQESCAFPDAVSRFLRGARQAMQLQSEHTARTLDAGRLPSGAPYVVSEMLSGCDLREVLRVRGQLGVSEAVDFILQASESVAEAHLHGLLHRSLNLTNLFATRRPDGSPLIKVLDFGVADSLRGEPLRAEDGTYMGFASFGSGSQLEAFACCSPEQIRGFSQLDVRADVWALGALLHELLSGYPLYQAESAPALLAMIAADPPPPVTTYRQDVPTELEKVILRCLEKDRNGRFPTLADLAQALKPFASPEMQSAADRITRTLGRSGRPSRPAHLGSALIHVGPAPQAPRKSAPAPVPAAGPGGVMIPQRLALLGSITLVAFGLVGGALAGVLMTTRSAPLAESRPPAALVPQTYAAIPAAGERTEALAQRPAEAPITAPQLVQTVPATVATIAAQPTAATPIVSTVPTPAVAPPPVQTSAPAATPVQTAQPTAPRLAAAPQQRLAVAPSPRPKEVARKAAAPPAAEGDGAELFDGMN